MPETDWDDVVALYGAARDRTPDAQSAVLRDRCSEAALREEVTALLSVSDEAAAFFEGFSAAVVAPTLGDDLGGEDPPRSETGPDAPSRAEEVGATEVATVVGTDAPDPLGLEGTEVRRYQIREHLGGGGMGEVYKAHDPALDRSVALKFLPPHLSGHSEAAERFVREARSAARLDHTHIATIHEIGETADGRRFIAMAYYEGQTLKEKIQEGPLPVEKALDYAEQMAEGLARAHRAGVVHRDVKPGNVMVTPDGTVKLVDFGLAQVASGTQITEPGRRLGTPAYMSPEQAEGEEVGPRTDVWALGVVLYEMLTGERPFSGGRQTAVLHSILHGEPTPLREHRAELPAALEEMVGTCLRKAPGRRYEDADALAQDLRALRRGEAPSRAETASETTEAPPTTVGRKSPDADPAEAPSGPDVSPSEPSRSEPADEAGGGSLLSWLQSPWGGGTAVAVGLVLVGLAGWALWSGGSATTGGAAEKAAPKIGERSIAVLPFEAIGQSEPGTFTAGMHEDLLTRLSNVSDLQVISQSSVERYRDTNLSVQAIADSLGVRWIMEGSVQKAGSQIQVNVQLIDPKTSSNAWASEYQRKLTAENIFSIQEEITREIAEALQAELGGGEERRIASAPTENLAAYRLYVRGREQLNRRTENGMRQAVRLFQKAIGQDSTYVKAWAGLSDALSLLHDYGYASSEVLPRAERAARRAVELDPRSAEARASLGLYYETRHEGPAAIRELERAVELRPGYAQAHNWLSWISLLLGKPSEGLQHARRAVRIDPLSPEAVSNLALAYLAIGASEKALDEARRTLEIAPSYTTGAFFEALALYRLGRYDDAASILKGLSVGWAHPGPRVTLGLVHRRQGTPAKTRAILSDLDVAEHPFAVGLLRAALGRTDAAFVAFDRVDRWKFWPTFAVHHLYRDVWAPLQDDPRYRTLIREVKRSWGLQPGGQQSSSTSASARDARGRAFRRSPGIASWWRRVPRGSESTAPRRPLAHLPRQRPGGQKEESPPNL